MFRNIENVFFGIKDQFHKLLYGQIIESSRNNSDFQWQILNPASKKNAKREFNSMNSLFQHLCMGQKAPSLVLIQDGDTHTSVPGVGFVIRIEGIRVCDTLNSVEPGLWNTLFFKDLSGRLSPLR